MKNTEQLENALKLLREADAGKGASPFLETRLRAAFREHHDAKRRAFSFRWASVLAGLACTALVVWKLATPGAVEAPKPVPQVARKTETRTPETRLKVAQPGSVPAIDSVTEPRPLGSGSPKAGATFNGAVTAAVKPRNRTVAKAPRREAVPVQQAAVQEFIALPYAPPLSSWDRGQVMRVRLPRHSLRSMGIPVNEDRIFERVPADLLMGEDGVARAIRFVSASELR